jgi:LysR family transcriptional regulator for metE and metH
MDLEIRHLRLIDAIAVEGTVTRAGDRLHLTQSALSHQLRDIEDRLGIPLFHRAGRKMLPTLAGDRLLQSARNVLKELAAVEDEVRQEGLNREGLLRISTECCTCYNWLPVQLKRFREMYPRVDVRIVPEATRRPIQGILLGDVDIALVSDPVRNSKIVVEPLFDDEMFLITPPQHHYASKPYVTAQDFADLHLILYSADIEDLTIYQEVLIPAGVAPRRLSQIELTEAILEMVKADMGVGVMAGWVVEPLVKSGAVCAVRIGRRGLRRSWKAAMLRSSSRPRYYLDFIKLMAKSAPQPMAKSLRVTRKSA